MRALKTVLVLVCICTLTGCLTPPPDKHEVIWAKVGTPARVIDDSKAEVVEFEGGKIKVTDKKQKDVLVDKEDGTRVKAKANLQGKMVIDEPTFEYYRTLDQLYGRDYQKKVLEELQK